MPGGELGAGDEGRNFLLLDHLPVDKGLDVGVIDVDDDHLGGAPGRAAGFDGTGGAVADPQKTHQPRGAPATREPLAVAAQFREIRSRAGAVFEDPRLAHPEIHDPAFVDEIVGDRLDEAGMRLRVLVGAVGGAELAGLVVDVVMALRGAVDPIGPMEARVEPLRRVRRADLAREHQPNLVVERAGVLLGVEIAALPAPIGPGPGHTVEDLAGAGFAAVARGFGQARRCRLIGGVAPQPGWHTLFGDRRQAGRHTRLAEVLLGEDVRGDLAPLRRHLNPLGLKDHRAVGIADFAGRDPEWYRRVRILTGRRKPTRDVHSLPRACRCRRLVSPGRVTASEPRNIGPQATNVYYI